MTILKSLTITIIISLLIAYGLRNILGFWESFSLTFAIQIIASFVYSSFKITREQDIINLYQEEMDTLLDLSKAMVECPCGKNRFEDLVFINQENIFDCDVCNSKFKTSISITPTLLTEPVSVETTFDDLLQKQKEL